MRQNDTDIKTSFLRPAVSGLCLFFACLLGFYLSLVVAGAIPDTLIRDNLESSAQTLSEEGDYPRILTGSEGGQLDNFTTALMLNIIAHSSANPFTSALMGEHYTDSDDNTLPTVEFAGSITLDANTSYQRYWHGWLVILKPLLVFFDLTQIRALFFLATTLLLVAAAALLCRRTSLLPALILAIGFCAVNYPIAAISLSFGFTFLIALIGTIYVLQKINPQAPVYSEMHFGIVFFMLGATTVFFDFLDTPIITLGLPLLAYLLCRHREIGSMGFGAALIKTVRCCMAWGAAYFGLFAAKTLIVTVFLDPGTLESTIMAINQRTSGAVTHLEISSYNSVYRNLRLLLPAWVRFWLVGALIVGAILLLVSLPPAQQRKLLIRPTALLLLVAAFPLIWYSVFANHSITHYWFTYRDLVVSLVAFGFIFALWFDRGSLKARVQRLRGGSKAGCHGH
ncbi:MAG: hypothetical protein LBP28_08515 [Coriobacteriales bacterium]|jgi:hypothetical protein|nr:hypothetical protein [Coriobacteriales bacterium]